MLTSAIWLDLFSSSSLLYVLNMVLHLLNYSFKNAGQEFFSQSVQVNKLVVLGVKHFVWFSGLILSIMLPQNVCWLTQLLKFMFRGRQPLIQSPIEFYCALFLNKFSSTLDFWILLIFYSFLAMSWLTNYDER
jgi:hypothetical protein